MTDPTTIPPEILYNIIEYLNVLDSKGTPLIRYVQSQYSPPHIGITFHKSNPDLSLFDAMRVCRSWRNMIFQQVFKEDVTKWSPERWQEEIDRFRSAERHALVEMTRVFVVLWQKAHIGQPTGSTEVSMPGENRVNGVGEAAGSGAEPTGSVDNVQSDRD